mmetsp:Transcript_41032/g.49941  ORF Transcript_41032/g.49941 Transcript_41032/m.49941 type:complete len:280 (-) Transcript_41032:68-907(-)|eukprot:CAMPEP_0172496208 /NCGR_PEP_ID=MMETSP1066-20121228/83409_1 /TAXON_ID=671091 /ORGANISM="Coscinodiscus wailesii, Strain CCMP2513" /LENGTH=279 /DNA_ID=CAMNT_0013268387 /DNA_START=121 /DNA_END=960 /DNA_ORIENTATION=-
MADNVGGIDDMGGGPQEWFQSLPLITRFWFGGTCLCTCAANFGIVSPVQLVFAWEPVKDNFEIWRLVGPFCYAGKFSLPTLFLLYMVVHFSQRYETSTPYNTGGGGGTADYAFALLFCWACTLLSYPFLMSYIMPLFVVNTVYFVMYIWSKRNPNVQSNIWGIPVKTVYLPFAYLALNVLMGNPTGSILHGIAIGHAYYFLVEVVPAVYGKEVLNTPTFLIDYFGIGEYVPPVPANAAQPMRGMGNNTWAAPGRVQPPNDPAQRRNTGHNWGGGGRTLG